MKTALIGFVVIVAACLVWGFAKPTVTAQSATGTASDLPIFFAGAIDASDSGSEDDKLAYGRVTLDEIESLKRGQDQLRLFVFDHDVREIASEIPADTEAFSLSLRRAILQPIPCQACHGLEPLRHKCKACGGTGREQITSQAMAVAALANSLKNTDLRRYRVRLLIPTDGSYEDHSPAMEKLYEDSVKYLETIPNVEIVFWGVRPAQREGIRPKFSKLDAKGRFHIFGSDEEVKW